MNKKSNVWTVICGGCHGFYCYWILLLQFYYYCGRSSAAGVTDFITTPGSTVPTNPKLSMRLRILVHEVLSSWSMTH